MRKPTQAEILRGHEVMILQMPGHNQLLDYAKSCFEGGAIRVWGISDDVVSAAVVRDVAKAVKYCKVAIDLGSSEAKFLLAACYEEGGEGVERDFEEAFKLYKSAADQGDLVAKSKLIDCYEQGKGVEQNLEKVFESYKSAPESVASPEVVQELFNDVTDRLRKTKDRSISYNGEFGRVMRSCKKVADKGHMVAQYWYGHYMERQVMLDEWSIYGAASYYESSAKQGYAPAQYSLGLCYEEKKGVKKDFTKAAMLYKLAADQGYAPAQYSLGLCHEEAKGGKKDFAEAFKLYKSAADQGYAKAQYSLGLCYEKGNGVEKNLRKAFDLYKSAADQGYEAAQYTTGICYEEGKGTVENLNEAKKYYAKAVSQGHPKAKVKLEYCNYKIGGISSDVVDGFKFASEAASTKLFGTTDYHGNLSIMKEIVNKESDRKKELKSKELSALFEKTVAVLEEGEVNPMHVEQTFNPIREAKKPAVALRPEDKVNSSAPPFSPKSQQVSAAIPPSSEVIYEEAIPSAPPLSSLESQQVSAAITLSPEHSVEKVMPVAKLIPEPAKSEQISVVAEVKQPKKRSLISQAKVVPSYLAKQAFGVVSQVSEGASKVLGIAAAGVVGGSKINPLPPEADSIPTAEPIFAVTGVDLSEKRAPATSEQNLPIQTVSMPLETSQKVAVADRNQITEEQPVVRIINRKTKLQRPLNPASSAQTVNEFPVAPTDPILPEVPTDPILPNAPTSTIKLEGRSAEQTSSSDKVPNQGR